MHKFLRNTIGITMRSHSQHRFVAGNRHIISHFSSRHTGLVLDKRRPVRVERVSTQQRNRGATAKTITTPSEGKRLKSKKQHQHQTQQQQQQQQQQTQKQQQKKQQQKKQQRQTQQQQQQPDFSNQNFNSFLESMGGDPTKMRRQFQDTYQDVKQGLLDGEQSQTDIYKMFSGMPSVEISEQLGSMGLSLGPEFEQMKNMLERVWKTAGLIEKLEQNYHYANMAELDDYHIHLTTEEKSLLEDEMESFTRAQRGGAPIEGTIADMIDSTGSDLAGGSISETKQHLDSMKTLRSMQDMLKVFGKDDIIKTPITDEMLDKMSQVDSMMQEIQEMQEKEPPMSTVDRKEMAKKMDFEFEPLPEERGERQQQQPPQQQQKKVTEGQSAPLTPEAVEQIPSDDMNIVSAVVMGRMSKMSPDERKKLYTTFGNQFGFGKQEIAMFEHLLSDFDQHHGDDETLKRIEQELLNEMQNEGLDAEVQESSKEREIKKSTKGKK